MLTAKPQRKAKGAVVSDAEIVREYGPFPGAGEIHGVTFDGSNMWVATGDRLLAIDPGSGEETHVLHRACDAGTAFDGKYLHQIAAGRIDKIDPSNGAVVSSIPAPGNGSDSGLAWAEGRLWVGQHRQGSILEIDPETGTVLRTIKSDKFVTGVTWIDGELWHGTWQGGESEVRQIDRRDGSVITTLRMPRGVRVSGLESDGGELLFCGGGPGGSLRAIRRPRPGRSRS